MIEKNRLTLNWKLNWQAQRFLGCFFFYKTCWAAEQQKCETDSGLIWTEAAEGSWKVKLFDFKKTKNKTQNLNWSHVETECWKSCQREEEVEDNISTKRTCCSKADYPEHPGLVMISLFLSISCTVSKISPLKARKPIIIFSLFAEMKLCAAETSRSWPREKSWGNHHPLRTILWLNERAAMNLGRHLLCFGDSRSEV